jgi:hypothetical protein
VTTAADTDHRLLLELGNSTIRLADIARQSGHAAQAVAELWPLAARLEARIAAGHAERDILRLLARTTIGLGVALGNVLPEERLATAASWTAKSLPIAAFLDDRHLTVQALRMHGNELRKAGLRGAAVERLTHAAGLAAGTDDQAAVLPLLARAAGALGSADLFDRTAAEARTLLDRASHTSLFNPSSLYEIQLRGLVSTSRMAAAIELADSPPAGTLHTAPQWRVIEMITVAQVRLRADDLQAAVEGLSTAVREATAQRLPHQLQRVMRAAGSRLPEITELARHSLDRLRQEIAA